MVTREGYPRWQAEDHDPDENYDYDYYEHRNAQMREEYNRDRRQGRMGADYEHGGYDREEDRYEREFEDVRGRRRSDDRRLPRGGRGIRNVDAQRMYDRERRGVRAPVDGRYDRDRRDLYHDGSRESSPRLPRNGRARSDSHDRSRERNGPRDTRRDSRDYRSRSDLYLRMMDDNSEDSSDFYDHASHSSHIDSKAEDYRTQTPSNTVIIRGLAQHITEHDIKEDIIKCGLMPKDIRLIRRKDTGASRGFAFVEFNTKQEASRWIETKQGELILHDQYRAVIHYSISVKCVNDWVCSKCGGHNFRRRDTCYKCCTSRLDSRDDAEEQDEVSRHPTHAILLRNLDILTTEETVKQALRNNPSLPMQHVLSVRLGRDPLTNTSLGMCYIECSSVANAINFYRILNESHLEIDGKRVLVSYCKVNDANSQSSCGEGILYSSAVTQYTESDIPRLAEYSASLYATTPQEHATYLQYYTEYFQNQVKEGGTISLPSQTQMDSVNAAAAVAQSAIQQVLAAKGSKKGKGASVVDSAAYYAASPATISAAPTIAAAPVPATSVDTSVAQYPTPDVSTYQLDKASGYYYDPQTGLYYDASSQYYYNSQTQQFLYWDCERHTYVAAPQSSQPSQPSQTPATTPSTPTATPATAPDDADSKDDKKGKEKEKQDRVKVAKKVVKEMEKWARMLNQKKENAQQNLTLASASLMQAKSSGTADIGYAVLERKDLQAAPVTSPRSLPFTLSDPEPSVLAVQSRTAESGSSLVPRYGGGSDSEDGDDALTQLEDSQLTNWVKLACLLCKRQFPTKDALVRHQQLSDLHKENLAKWRLSRK
ncbi:RNA-binding protein 5-like isoform X2 [Bacillus rossius redtenbacheri]|uniref:RNA-binding protein 5-like isoform X2 n=1 Tax=Bacillus rossius redtenbacheri TaxID=93214 RepID=UPI002FDD03DB